MNPFYLKNSSNCIICGQNSAKPSPLDELFQIIISLEKNLELFQLSPFLRFLAIFSFQRIER